MKIDEKVVTITTWKEFCNSLGYSVEKVDTDLRNLRFFGEQAFKSMQDMGLGNREMLQMRKLPEEEQGQILEADAFKNGDVDGIKQLVETLVAANQAERDALVAKHKQELKEVTEKEKRFAEAHHNAEIAEKREHEKTKEDFLQEKAALQKILRDKEIKIDTLDAELSAAERKLPESELVKTYKPKINERELALVTALHDFRQLVAEIHGQEVQAIELFTDIAVIVNSSLNNLSDMRNQYGLELPDEAYDPAEEAFWAEERARAADK